MSGSRQRFFAGAMVAAFVLCTGGEALAQAWTRDAGKGYLELSLGWLKGDELYAPNFERRDLPTDYEQIGLGFYGEVGVISRWLTLSASGELYRSNQLDDQGRTAGLGDITVGAWSGVLAGPFRLTVGAVLGIPTGDDSPSAGGDDPNTEIIAASLPTGDGEWDFEPRVVAGYSFGGHGWPLKHYVTGSLGYMVRTKGFADGISYGLELGSKVPFSVLDRIWLQLGLRGIESFASDKEAGQGASGLGNGVTYTVLSAQIFADIYEGIGLAMEASTAVRARSIISSVPLRWKLSYSF